MSNYFEYNDYPFRELADSLEHDIAKALQPKPDKTKHDYWVIYTKETPYSFRSYSYQNEYANAETAIADLLKHVEAKPAPQELRQTYFPNETIVYADQRRCMENTPDGEQVPVLYAIHHCRYEAYDPGSDVLDLSDDAIALLKEAYTRLRQADIYARMAERLINESETSSEARAFLSKRLDQLTQEIETKDWSERWVDNEQ